MIKRTKPGKDGQVKVTFSLPAQEPEGAVSVVGTFNGWDPHAHPLKPRKNGQRTAVVSLPTQSTVHFRYLGDNGVWFDDTDADAVDPEGSRLHL